MKRSVMFFGLVPGVLFFLAVSNASVYYVDQDHTGASDANTGTAASPWLTLNKAASTAAAGDTVNVRTGTYRETIRIMNSGTAGNMITFRAYPGDSVVINGADIITGWEHDSASIYVKRDIGFNVLGVFQDDTKLWPALSTSVLGGGGALENQTKADMEQGWFCYDGDNDDLYVWCTNDADPATHRMEVQTRPAVNLNAQDYIRIEGFTIRYAGSDWRGGLYNANGGVSSDYCDIVNCRFEDCCKAGLSVESSTHWTIRNCVFMRNFNQGILFMDPTGLQTVIEECYFEGNGWQPRQHFAYEEPWTCGNGDAIGGQGHSAIIRNNVMNCTNMKDGIHLWTGSDIQVMNNYIYNAWHANVYFERFTDGPVVAGNLIVSDEIPEDRYSIAVSAGDTPGLVVTNNTLVNLVETSNAYPLVLTRRTDLTVRNNILYSLTDKYADVDTAADYDAAYNCYHSPAGVNNRAFVLDGTGGRLDAYTETGIIKSDPAFTSAAGGDYRLSAGSPCIDTGSPDIPAEYVVDMDSVAIPGMGVDLGAYQYAEAGIIVLPADKVPGLKLSPFDILGRPACARRPGIVLIYDGRTCVKYLNIH